jgi:hypothetical protein
MASPLQTKMTAIRAAVLSLLQGALPAGVPAYDYIRNVNHEETLAALMKDTGGKMHFWWFALSGDDPLTSQWFPSCTTRFTAQFDLEGYMAVQDLAASEKTFEGEVADVICTFSGDSGRTLSSNVIGAGPVQRPQGRHVMLGSVLLHYARLRLACEFETGC